MECKLISSVRITSSGRGSYGSRMGLVFLSAAQIIVLRCTNGWPYHFVEYLGPIHIQSSSLIIKLWLCSCFFSKGFLESWSSYTYTVQRNLERTLFGEFRASEVNWLPRSSQMFRWIFKRWSCEFFSAKTLYVYRSAFIWLFARYLRERIDGLRITHSVSPFASGLLPPSASRLWRRSIFWNDRLSVIISCVKVIIY